MSAPRLSNASNTKQGKISHEAMCKYYLIDVINDGGDERSVVSARTHNTA